MLKQTLSCATFVHEEGQKDLVSSTLSKFYSIDVDNCLDNSYETIEYLKNNHPDVLFLNLEYADLLSIINKPPFIIGVGKPCSIKKLRFYLNSGFTDFVFTPTTEREIRIVIGKIMHMHATLQDENHYPMAAEESRAKYNQTEISADSTNSIFINSGKRRGACRVPLNEILYAKNTGNEVKLILENGSSKYDKTTLRNFQRKLPNKFMKINRSIVINTEKVKRINKRSVILGDETFNVTRSFYKQFSRFFKI